MRTLIISDLHLGSASGADVLRREDLRAPLLAALSDVDRLVLLGDILELRHGPLRDAMAAARPFFEDLGRALAGRELIITAGNHDHALIEPWLMRRGEEHVPPPLGVEQLLDPLEVSPALERIAGWAAPARVRVAYPGLWVRPDVYATHGHYLDCHLTMPTLERLSVGAMSRVLGRPAQAFACVDDYEAVSAPMFAWRDAVARDGRPGAALNGVATVGVWRALGGRVAGGSVAGSGRRLSPRARASSALGALRTRALVAAFPLAVAAINRAGIGPVRADVSAGELRRAGLNAMAEVAARLGLGDAHVVFGHTHRAGALPGEHGPEWRAGRLINAGCWTYSPAFLTSTLGESPYWPGACVLVEDSGPPVLKRLLQDRTHAELGHPGRTP
jgi:predicted phosphodiesterase